MATSGTYNFLPAVGAGSYRRRHPKDAVYYVYLFRDADGVPRYVGKGKGGRIKDHFHPNCRSILGREISSGKIFTFEKIEENLTEEQSFDLERRWIAEFGRKQHGGTLYNLTNGGQGTSGVIATLERRQKISLALTGKLKSHEHRANLSSARKGMRQSPESVAKTAAANRGRKNSPEHIAASAAANRGMKRSSEARAKMSAALRKRVISNETRAKLSAAGKGRAPSDEHRAKMAVHLRKKIECINTREIFNSATEAALSKNVDRSKVCAVARGDRKSTCGLQFRYLA